MIEKNIRDNGQVTIKKSMIKNYYFSAKNKKDKDY